MKTYEQIVAQNNAISALTTFDECLLASHNAVACGDANAARAIQIHAAGSLDRTGDPTEITILMVIGANIRMAEIVDAATAVTGMPSTLPLLDCGYGTVITR